MTTATHVHTAACAHRRRLPLGLPPVAAPIAVGIVTLAGCCYLALVNPSTSGAYPRCPFNALTGLYCPGCGTARALHSLLVGDFTAALGYNLLAVLAVPFLLYQYAAWSSTYGPRPIPRLRRAPAWALAALAIAFVVFAVVRNLPVEPLTALAP